MYVLCLMYISKYVAHFLNIWSGILCDFPVYCIYNVHLVPMSYMAPLVNEESHKEPSPSIYSTPHYVHVQTRLHIIMKLSQQCFKIWKFEMRAWMATITTINALQISYQWTCIDPIKVFFYFIYIPYLTEKTRKC